MLEIALRHDGHHVETVTSGEQATHKLDSALYDVVVTDVRMPGISGMEVLRHARRVSPETRVIVITAVDDNETSIQAQNAGALYVRKLGANLPTDVRAAVQSAMENHSLRQQNAALKRDAAAHNSLDHIIGDSTVMHELKRLIRTVATTNSTVIVTGESGTGKELVARAIHGCSPRSAEPFVSINCGAFPETLLESELFGYVKGAFTGANQNKRGLFELADGGTIFLDEISEMSLTMQVKLLRVLQERVGASSRRRQRNSDRRARDLPPPTRTWTGWSPKDCSAKTCFTGCALFPSMCRRCANGAPISSCWQITS